jgi:hypothetical protein
VVFFKVKNPYIEFMLSPAPLYMTQIIYRIRSGFSDQYELAGTESFDILSHKMKTVFHEIELQRCLLENNNNNF